MESINRPELVREHNLNLVREQLFRVRQATRQQLSALTGISDVTLGSLLGQLLETGEVLEGEKAQPTSGRPARIYSYNPRRNCGLLVSVGFHGGQYQFQAVLIDLYGKAIWEETQPASILDREATMRYFERLLFCLQGPVRAVGIGLPGVGFGTYFYRNASSQYFSLQALDELAEKSSIPFLVENDVNLMALGYAHRRQTGPEETMAYLYLMKGCYGGSAIYLNGKLHRGKNRFAGELLPPPYGSANWFEMASRPEKEWEDALLSTVLPYLTILAPHRVVIASDYLEEKHLFRLEANIPPSLLSGFTPSFALADDFNQDYREGLKQLVLKDLTGPIFQKKGN